MAKQNNNTADGGEPVKGGGVNDDEQSPAATTIADGGEPVKGGGVNAGEQTPAQKFAATKKAEFKQIRDDENAAYKAEQAAKQAAEKEKAGIVEDEDPPLEDIDYTKHNTHGHKLKAKLAAAKAEAIKSIPLEVEG